ncbi:hypothetical protein GCM10007390_16090 [Persicitalea jodogahamensis]|uniref:Exopolysaccharide biosynthesis protein YbjH n=2 Tax=Persicitalea jodogahamensis TaxID=402147 RepID=A0A8J3G857_9BACT|nr:hypothetical protein GCM10007390_16090 [Persicitalea jodogahamensis]
MENVSQDSAAVFYEQRLFRNPLQGLVRMLPACGARDSCTLIPMIQGVPVGVYTLGDDLRARPVSVAERRAYYGRSRINPFKYLLDFRLQPEVVANFGNPTQTVQARLSVMLQSQLYLWRGMALNFGLLFPVMNNLDQRPNGVRLAPLYLNQFLALGENHFISGSAGFFQNDRYGVNIQYQRMNPNSRWTYGLEASMTGFYYYPKGGIYYTSINELLLLGNAAYRFNDLDFTVKLTGGRYLDGDVGARLDLVRQFPNVEVALFAIQTSNGGTIGFNFAVPIPPGKILRAGPARLRTSEEFRWEYAYARGYGIGNRYRLGYQLDERLRQYNASYLRNQWKRLE